MRPLRPLALLVALPIAACGTSSTGDSDGPAVADLAVADLAVASPGDAATSPPDLLPLPPRDGQIAGDAGPSSALQTARPLGTDGAPNGYYEYLPPGYGDGNLRPLLVFWHGIGENGNGTTELTRVLANGPPRLIQQNKWALDRPFVVLSAQHSGGGCPNADEIHTFITFALAHYQVDPKRAYLTGLSCGAIGSWSYLGKYRGTAIAAAVLIAGDGRNAWNTAMCNLGQLAIWGFHGESDGTVSPQGTIVPMTNLIACPMPPRKDARLTTYPMVGHDSWSRTYDLTAGHDIYAWLLGMSK